MALLRPRGGMTWSRVAARALVRDDRDRVLVIHVAAAGQEWLELPGGGVDRGEEPGATAAREVGEETGYRTGPMSAPVAVRRTRFRIGPVTIEQEETIHTARVVGARGRAELESIELATHRGLHWLHPDELVLPPARLDPPELARLCELVPGVAPLRLPETDWTAMRSSSPWGVRPSTPPG